MNLYTSKVVAEWLGLTERRVRQLRDEGVIEEYKPGLYELKRTVIRYITYLRKGSGSANLNDERAALTRAKREAAEMDNELRRGTLHRTEDIEKGLMTVFLNMWYGGSAKEDIEDNIDVLRQRSRDAYMGVPIASAAVKTMRTNVIAGGLMPAPQIDAKFLKLSDEEVEDLQERINREFSLWADSPNCDADRMDDFWSLQQLAFLGFILNGDTPVLLPMKRRTGGPYSLQVRVLEADQMCSPDGFDRLIPCQVRGRRVQRIVQGVETDEDGAVCAYWICNRHPLSSSTVNGEVKLEWTRVEAFGANTGRRNALHVMQRERAGQVRGVPLLAPVIESIKQLGRYTEAEITAAVISAYFTVFVYKENPSDGRPFGEMVADEDRVDDVDEGSIEMAPGAILDLNPGEKVNFANPTHPNTNYDAFTAAMFKQIGAALEISPEVLIKQFSTSYSASRGSLNEFWRVCGMYRDWFVQDFCQPIYEEWFTEAVALGRIWAPGYFDDPAIRKAYTGCVWNGPARTNLNPVQEVTAAEKRVAAGFSTAQEETQQMTGGDYTRNMRQRKIEAALKREVDQEIQKGQSERDPADQDPPPEPTPEKTGIQKKEGTNNG